MIMDYTRTFLLNVNALACVQNCDMVPMLRNVHLSYTVQNHAGVNVTIHVLTHL